MRFSGSEAIVAAGAAWLVTGMAVGLWFVLFRIDRRDPAARGSFAFRPLLLPGLMLLWPLVLLRWNVTPEAGLVRHHKRIHLVVWGVLTLLLAGVLALALALRRTDIPERPSLRLSATVVSQT